MAEPIVVNVLILGCPQVGKSTLCGALVGKELTKDNVMAVESYKYTHADGTKYKLQVKDPVSRYATAQKQMFKQLDVALACFDVVDQDSLLRVLDELDKFEAQKMATCLLVGTKQDKAPEMAELFDAVKQEAQKFGVELKIILKLVSAEHKTGIEQLRLAIVENTQTTTGKPIPRAQGAAPAAARTAAQEGGQAAAAAAPTRVSGNSKASAAANDKEEKGCCIIG